MSRRRLIGRSIAAAMWAMLGCPVPFRSNVPAGLWPVAFGADASDPEAALLSARPGLAVLSDRPVNAETPAHLLDDSITPADRHFVRNNGLLPPQAIRMEAAGWTLTVDGRVERPLRLTLEELRTRFEVVRRRIVLECAGNGRAYFNPPVAGNQWTTGAVGCAEWTGVRLRDVLNHAGVKPDAVYTGHYGADLHLSRDPSKQAISRGVPIAKAMEESNLIAFEMNSRPIPALNGFPLRLVIAGWPASCSQKWLTRIQVREVKHDGAKMAAPSYCLPTRSLAPGAEMPPLSEFQTIESMPVKSLITFPQTGTKVAARAPVQLRGHAWAGDRTVASMHVSLDFGATWQPAQLQAPANAGAWQDWSVDLTLPSPGYYECWARAIDSAGVAQPPVTPGWNPEGYCNNMQHRIALVAG
jgi:DMSO/TMAO reductase YedYZ molybdopterin-dependent catalytic subunit